MLRHPRALGHTAKDRFTRFKNPDNSILVSCRDVGNRLLATDTSESAVDRLEVGKDARHKVTLWQPNRDPEGCQPRIRLGSDRIGTAQIVSGEPVRALRRGVLNVFHNWKERRPFLRMRVADGLLQNKLIRQHNLMVSLTETLMARSESST